MKIINCLTVLNIVGGPANVNTFNRKAYPALI